MNHPFDDSARNRQARWRRNLGLWSVCLLAACARTAGPAPEGTEKAETLLPVGERVVTMDEFTVIRRA